PRQHVRILHVASIRQISLEALMKKLLTVVLAAALLAACQSPVDRTGRILTMAGEEAVSIPNKQDRFKHQLNIADILLNSGRHPEADKMLLLARDTLNDANKTEIDDFHRIAG